MLVKDVMKYIQSDIKKLNPKSIWITIFDYETDDKLFQDINDFNLQIPQNLLNRKVDFFDIIFYVSVSSLHSSITVKEVSNND